MGYQPTVYNLTFDDLDGLEVKAHGTSIGQVKRFMSFSDGKASPEQTLELFEAFGKALISWNLEDHNGQPVPATAQGIDEYPDSRLMAQIVNTWIEAVSGVDEELGKTPALESRSRRGPSRWNRCQQTWRASRSGTDLEAVSGV